MRRGVQMIALLWAGAIVVVATLARFAQSLHGPIAGYFRREWDMDKPTALEWSLAVQKSLHLPAYALLTILAWCAVPAGRRHGGVVLALVMAVAVVDESLQAFNPNRSGSLLDLVVDLAGAMLGLFVAMKLCPGTRGMTGPRPGP